MTTITKLNEERRVKLYKVTTCNKHLSALLCYFQMQNFHYRKRFAIRICQNQSILVRRYLCFSKPSLHQQQWFFTANDPQIRLQMILRPEMIPANGVAKYREWRGLNEKSMDANFL